MEEEAEAVPRGAPLKLKLTRRAERDLDEIWVYVRERNPVAADELLDKIIDAIDGLLSHPRMGRKGLVKNTRELVVSDTPYVVAYRVLRGTIVIARVLHGARAWPRRL